VNCAEVAEEGSGLLKVNNLAAQLRPIFLIWKKTPLDGRSELLDCELVSGGEKVADAPSLSRGCAKLKTLSPTCGLFAAHGASGCVESVQAFDHGGARMIP